MSDFLQLDEKTLYNAKAVGFFANKKCSKDSRNRTSGGAAGLTRDSPVCTAGILGRAVAWFVFGLSLVSNEFGNTVSTCKSHVRLRNTVRHQTLSP